MKKFRRILLGILVVLIVAVGVSYLFAPDVIEIHLETEIDAPAEEVWQILAHQFGDIADWSATVNESRSLTMDEIPDGFDAVPNAPAPARATVAGPGISLTEVITMYSEEAMELTFEGTNLPPLVFEYAKDTQRVIPVSANQSLLTFDVSVKTRGIFKAVNPLLARRFAASFGTVQQELKVYAETGSVAQ